MDTDKTLDDLAKEYINREPQFVEDGEYTDRTIEEAYKAGAMAVAQILLLFLAAQQKIKTESKADRMSEMIKAVNSELLSRSEIEPQVCDKNITPLITWNDARNPPDHERKVLLMNRRAGVEYSTGWYDRENEQWNVDDRTMIAVDYWREIHE